MIMCSYNLYSGAYKLHGHPLNFLLPKIMLELTDILLRPLKKDNLFIKDITAIPSASSQVQKNLP